MHLTLDSVLCKYDVKYPYCGASVGPGWVPLVDRLIARLIDFGWDRDCHQIKEKFGGLRFYIGAGSEELWSAIDDAEKESVRTCEECGAPGVRRSRGWIKTLCDDHAGGRGALEAED